jgi:hypothetical protein
MEGVTREGAGNFIHKAPAAGFFVTTLFLPARRTDRRERGGSQRSAEGRAGGLTSV